MPRFRLDPRTLLYRRSGRRRRLSKAGWARLWQVAGVVLILLLMVLLVRQLMRPAPVFPDGSDRLAPAQGSLPPPPGLELALAPPPPGVTAADLAAGPAIGPLPPALAALPLPLPPPAGTRPGPLADLVPVPSELLQRFALPMRRAEAAEALAVAARPADTAPVAARAADLGDGAPAGPVLAALGPSVVVRPPAVRLPPAPRQPGPAGEALVAIVIDDIGPAHLLSRRAVAMPGPMTMAFLPYADDLPALIARAEAAGHEIFLHMPMEPLGDAEPGPNALTTRMSPDELRRALGWALARVPGARGINNHMGSRMTASSAGMTVVMQELKARGLPFLDSRTIGNSVAGRIAAGLGVAGTTRDIFLDHFPGARFVDQQLQAVERLARHSGTALAIGHPYDSTLGRLASWIPAAKARGIRFVTATELIAARACRTGAPGCPTPPALAATSP